MPIIPLYQTHPACSDAWNRVGAPGGYESWDFYAQDESEPLALMVRFQQGDPFDPQYLRRYAQFRKRPTRAVPPLPAQFPAVHVEAYIAGFPMFAIHQRFPAADFEASDQQPGIKIGPNRFESTADGLTLHFQDDQGLSGQLLFQPRSAVEPLEVEILSSTSPAAARAEQSGVACAEPGRGACAEHSRGAHHWLIPIGHCDVRGEIQIPFEGASSLLGATAKSITLHGTGFHDHHYGTSPLTQGFRQLLRGRILLPDGTLAFYTAHSGHGRGAGPADQPRPAPAAVIATTTQGIFQLDATDFAAVWDRKGPGRVPYPSRVDCGQTLVLRSPRVVASQPMRLVIEYDAFIEGIRAKAYCEALAGTPG